MATKKKTDAERLSSFLKRNNLMIEDLKRIAEDYANTEESKARTYFTEKYAVSEHVFYTCINLAIICHIVDEKTRMKIKKKAKDNYKMHNDQEKTRAADNKHAALVRRRKEFFDLIPNRDIIDISIKYAEGIKLSVISDMYGMCVETIKLLLAKGITELITPSSVVSSMRDRVKKEGRNLLAFEKLERKREVKRAAVIKPLEDEIEVLSFEIAHYEYFDGDPVAPTMEYLKERLKVAEKKYEAWLDF